MSKLNDAIELINKGLSGENKGIPMGIHNLTEELCGVQPSTYTLLGSESGTGKTSLVDTIYCINPLEAILNKQKEIDKTLKILYFSLEIDKNRKILKWICVWLFKKYGIIIDSKTLTSARKNKLSSDIYDKIVEAKDYFDILLDNIIFHDSKINPTGIYKKTLEYCKSVGKIIPITNVYNGKEYISHKYVKNNPKEIVLSIKDHIGLMSLEQGFDKKKNLDTNSGYNIALRNNYQVSHVDISQFNRSLLDVARKKFGEVMPEHGDFKDSGNTYEDCDICIALFSPSKHAISTYAGYNIDVLAKRIIFAYMLKNRDGEADVRIPLNFLGEAGFFRQMPKAEQLTLNPLFLEKAVKFLK